jgi:CAAX prenyl protease-like protein
MSVAPGARPPASDTIPIDYWLPMVLFGALTLAESYLDPAWFPIAYIVKAVLVTAALVRLRRPYADLKYDRRVILPSVAIGLLVFALWVWIDKVVPYPHFGSRSAFDPTPLQGSAWWPAFLAVRLYGLALMVPVMEEIFWRSFLLRYLTRTDFESLPVGTFSAFALLVMLAASAVAHPEWLVAVLASLAYAVWLRRSRSLFGAILAHSTTNAALGAYVLRTGEWQYW